MGDITRTIGVATGDESTVGAAIAWGQDSGNYDRSTDEILILQIVDAEEFVEDSLGLDGFTGTADSTNYVRLETASGVRHDGTYNTSKARIRGGGTDHVFTSVEDFSHLRHLAIHQDASSGSSQECVRIGSGINDVVIEKCVLRGDNTSDIDAVYTGNWAATVTVFDCAVLMEASGGRAGLHAQNFSGSSTQTWHIEHCSVQSGTGSAGGDGGISGNAGGTSTTNMNVWNCIAFDSVNDDYEDISSATWTGQGNLGQDAASCTARLTSTNNLNSQTVSVTDEAATEVLVTTLTAGSENLQLIDGGSASNTALANAIDPGSRDSRITLGFDIAGNARPGTFTDRDSGCFQVITAGGNHEISMGAPDALVITENTPVRVLAETIVVGAPDALAISEETPERSTLINAGAVDSLVITETTPERSTLIDAGAVDALIIAETTATVSILISVPAGSMTLTGLVPITIGTLLELPSTVALIISEETPVRLLNHIRAPPLDAVAFGENLTPTLFRNAIRSPALDPLVISGETAITNRFSDPGADALIFGGDAPTLLHTSVRAPALDALIFGGDALTLFHNAIRSPALDALVFSSVAPLPFSPITKAPGLDTLVLTGEQATRGTGLKIVGYAPLVRLDKVLPLVGSLSISGQSITLSEGETVLPSTGSMAISGVAPSLVAGIVTTPALDALAFGSAASDPIVTTPESPSVGAITLTGLQPTILGEVQPSVASLIFTGVDLSVLVGQTGTPIENRNATTDVPSNYEVCDLSHFRQLPGSMKLTWNRLAVRKKSWDERHPSTQKQYGHSDRNRGPQRAEPDDVFLEDNEVKAEDL